MIDLSEILSSLTAFLTGTTYGAPTGIVVSVGLGALSVFMAKQKNYSTSELFFALAVGTFLLTILKGGN